jgi:UrcA family protein
MTRTFIGAASLGLAIASLGLATSARAQGNEEEVTVEAQPVAYVYYSDLNLASPSGVNQLNARVHRAATKLCIENGVQPLARVMAGKVCRDDAIAGAADQVQMAIARFGNSQYSALSQIAVSLRTR